MPWREGTKLSAPTSPNDLWCADYKGEFMLTDKRYCYPLTITDFASASAIFGLSKLSVWWLRLGIGIERIQPGKPQQNGRHERMHLTLEKETTKPAANNFLQQQEKFALHRVLQPGTPAPGDRDAVPGRAVSTFSSRLSRPERARVPVPRPHHRRHPVRPGVLRLAQNQLEHGVRRQNVGVKEVDEKVWLISFMHYDLGFFDHESNRFEWADSPFAAKVLPMSSV